MVGLTSVLGATPTLVATTVNGERARKVYEAVKAWDLEVVGDYCVQENIYQPEEIKQVVDEYARFIALATVFGSSNWVPISKKLDDFWHTHIIFTQDYTAMCSTVVGHYVHHRPRILDNGTELDNQYVARTLQLYRECFGLPDMKFWDGAMCTCQVED